MSMPGAAAAGIHSCRSLPTDYSTNHCCVLLAHSWHELEHCVAQSHRVEIRFLIQHCRISTERYQDCISSVQRVPSTRPLFGAVYLFSVCISGRKLINKSFERTSVASIRRGSN
jgi:hypothetical protein